ncbi:MAG: RHS repeat-associated core domain-containing protein [Bdellovibrionaceae bacterium]|nr:RHS repeat-associated core domain-containing protein [Bdellovibrionales bacterium]MCB9083778.1 RHS repeat-associated core domain-containing protein [Pseudobdellovibrionaceae bacterium]
MIEVNLPSGKNIEYQIDGEGRRLAKKVNGLVEKYFVHDFNGRLIAELNPAGSVTAQFVYVTQSHSPDMMIKNATEYRFVKDHLGSIRAVVNSQTGVIEQRMSYDEFGVVMTDSNPGFQPFGFAGGHYDHETQLVRFGARDYMASVGRWTAKDPIRFKGEDTNLYSYVRNAPMILTDQDGLIATPEGPNEGGGNVPAGPETSEIAYGHKCVSDNNMYYCTAAPELCKNLLPGFPNSDPSNCMRACLQRKENENNSNYNSACEDKGNKINEFVKHEISIHVECEKSCASTLY